MVQNHLFFKKLRWNLENWISFQKTFGNSAISTIFGYNAIVARSSSTLSYFNIAKETYLKLLKKVDHTNLIIRPQAFGRLRPVSYLLGLFSQSQTKKVSHGTVGWKRGSSGHWHKTVIKSTIIQFKVTLSVLIRIMFVFT